MLTIEGIYENGKLHLQEPVDSTKSYKVFVTFLEDFTIKKTKQRKLGGLGGKAWMAGWLMISMNHLKI